MTITEAIKQLEEQNKALLQILDRISELQGRVPGEILDRLIGDVAETVKRGEVIDSQLSELLDQAG